MVKKFTVRGSMAALLASFFIFPMDSGAAPVEDKEFRRIIKIFKAGNEQVFERESYFYLKKFPRSPYIADIRLMQADIESDPELALRKYRIILKHYRYFPHRDYSLIKICEILDLKGEWQTLYKESAQGMRLFPESRYIDRFKFMHITSSIMLNRFDQAREECLKIATKTHDKDTLAEAIFYLAAINKKTTGNSRSYIKNLTELGLGFKNSEKYPSILYKLAEFHRERGNLDMAYWAYRDITSSFPKSPEARFARRDLSAMKKKPKRRMNYIPSESQINSISTIDIAPDRDVSKDEMNIYYAISIGPFSKKYMAEKIQRLLRSYPENELIETNFGFTIYIGKFTNTERALAMRIRLAEEFGINGTIVRISIKSQRSYIYKD